METNRPLADGSVPDRWQEKQIVEITPAQLKAIAPTIRDTAIEVFLPHINKNLSKYQIDTPKRIAAFLAQILHESGNLRYVKEIWGPTLQQRKYERDFSQPWHNKLTRKDRNYVAYNLGNTEAGDGKFYMGRSLIQTTGRNNYKLCSIAIFGDAETLLKKPQLLEVPEYAVQSAFWYCCEYRKLLDEFDSEGIEDETQKVNGGYNGLIDRKAIYERGLLALNA